MLDRVMALATAVTVAATLTGCGGSTEPRVAAEAAPSVEQLDIVDLASMRSSLWSLAAAGGDSVGVVVEGAGAGDPLRPALSVVEPDGTVAQRVALPVDNPLYGLDVAFDAEVAVVTGLLCARWTSLGDPPDLAATDEGTPEAACGSSSWVAGVWERSTGRWSELAVPAGSQVEALRYGRAVMSSVEPGSDGRWPERHLALVDTRSPGNEPAALDQFPVDPGGDVDAEVVLCLADSQVVSLVRWVEGEGPDGLPADATVLHSAGAQRWAAFVHEDKGWIAAEVDGTAPGPEAVGICTDGGIAAIAGDGAGAVLEAEGDRLRWKTVAGLPPVDSGEGAAR